MALWYQNGNGFVKISFARLSFNADAYLFCPGPSLNEVDIAMINVPGIYKIAMNTAYPRIRPDMWIGMDKPECYQRDLWWQSFIKIARGGYQDLRCEEFTIQNCPNVYFADVIPYSDDGAIFKNRERDIQFIWKKHTLATTLQILIWMGFAKIHFIGCDFGGSKDYYDERKLEKDRRTYNRQLYQEQVTWLKWLYDMAKIKYIELISCTRDSPINAYMPYISLEDALKNSQQNIPGNTQVVHSLDAEKNK